MSDCEFHPARADQADQLADIRVHSMQASLSAIGRFDPQRARDRLLATFNAANTTIITLQGEIIGFYVLRDETEAIYLDHLYLKQHNQGQGVGRRAMAHIQAIARQKHLPIRLNALINSPANAFYLANGFQFVECRDVDNFYIWQAEQPVA